MAIVIVMVIVIVLMVVIVSMRLRVVLKLGFYTASGAQTLAKWRELLAS